MSAEMQLSDGRITLGVASHYVDGEWIAEGPTFKSINPHDGSLVCEAHAASDSMVDRAVAAAKRSFDDGVWSSLFMSERSDYLFRLADKIDEYGGSIARLVAMEMGKQISLSYSSDSLAAIEKIRYFAGAARAVQGNITTGTGNELLDLTMLEPVGVCALVIPWNDPVDLLARKLAPALMAGCSVVIKSSEETPASTETLVRLCDEFPPGVVNLVHGFGGETGQALVSHRDVAKVSFTGSSATGRKIMAAAAPTLKRLSLECGGKAPSLVFDDANLEKCLTGLSYGAFLYSGQSCTAVTRILVDEAIYDEFLPKFVAKAEAMSVGDPLDDSNLVGPLVADRQVDRAKDLLASAVEDGASILCGGEFDGRYIRPTVVVDVPPTSRIACEEVFAPVVVIFKVSSEKEMLEIANSTPYGLGASVWTKDVSRAQRVMRGLKFGDVWINTYYRRFAETSFGGWKQSGVGRELGMEGLKEYFSTKRVAFDAREKFHTEQLFPAVPAGEVTSA
jgi:acyl-CoA reductase-like NAD-dependent aldehyde dehydrogenase